jgi:predicted flavoprotein YhiN
MESRRVKGLYLAGEVLDVVGPCGGYNLQYAFSSGAVAGKAAGSALDSVGAGET